MRSNFLVDFCRTTVMNKSAKCSQRGTDVVVVEVRRRDVVLETRSALIKRGNDVSDATLATAQNRVVCPHKRSTGFLSRLDAYTTTLCLYVYIITRRCITLHLRHPCLLLPLFLKLCPQRMNTVSAVGFRKERVCTVACGYSFRSSCSHVLCAVFR